MKNIKLIVLIWGVLTVISCTEKIKFNKTFNIDIETTTNVIEDRNYVVSEGDMVSITVTEEGNDAGGSFISADLLLDGEVINHFSELPYNYQFEIKDMSNGLHNLTTNLLITQFNTRKTLSVNVGLLVK